MKNCFVGFLMLLVTFSIKAQGIEFFQGTFDEALAKAKNENKIVFMDAYAEWCGPCKRMAATTFKEAEVGRFFNDNFINVKMDMEKGEGPGLQNRFDVTAYPTLLFVGADGKLVHKGVGGYPSEQFMALARTALGKIDNSKDFEKAYNEGKREPQFIYSYVRTLARAGKQTGKIVNDFLQKAEMKDSLTLKIIYEGTNQADSRIFDLLIQNRGKIVALYSDLLVQQKIQSSCQRTIENAAQFRSPEMFKDAKNKMKQHVPSLAETFALEADLRFYKASQDAKNYCKACETALKKNNKGDARSLYATAKTMVEAFPQDKIALGEAEKYLKKAASTGGVCEYYYLYAQVLLKNGKKKDALDAATRALQIAKETAPNYVPASEQLIDEIKQQG